MATITRIELQIEREKRERLTAHDVVEHVPSHAVLLEPLTVREKIFIFVANSAREVTRAEVAKALGVKKATWIGTHLERLVNEGVFSRRAEPYNTYFWKYYYTLKM